MKKSAWYVVLLLVVLIAAVAVCVSALRSGKDEPQPTPPPAFDVPASETPEAPPEETPENSPESQVTPTPVPTEPPVFETKEPIVETTPEPTPPPAANASGSFGSNTGTGLNMKVVWESFTAADGSAKLRVDVYATHYSFNTSALYNAVTVTVGGRSYSLNSEAVSYDGDELAESLIASCTVDAPAGGAAIDVVWDYKGSYSGTELETIRASGYVSGG